jgi:hypothetical protein
MASMEITIPKAPARDGLRHFGFEDANRVFIVMLSRRRSIWEARSDCGNEIL